MHLVDVELLRQSYFWLQKSAAAGVDGMTWHQYGEELEPRLEDLHGRIYRNAYRAMPSRRQYIPKADGRMRPLGIAALEDKIVQRAVVEVSPELQPLRWMEHRQHLSVSLMRQVWRMVSAKSRV